MPKQYFIAELTKILEGEPYSGLGWQPNDQEEKDYARTLVTDLLKANPNHPHALNLCGYMHRNGYWTGSIDYAQAIHFYDKAIENGSLFAMRNRAYMHKNANGGSPNLTAAKALCLKASESGWALALETLADIYVEEANFTEAIKCYQRIHTLRPDSFFDKVPMDRLESWAKLNLDVQQLLCLIYIKKNNQDKLNQIHQLNPAKLNAFLYGEIIKRLNELPTNWDYIQPLIDFVQEQAIKSEGLPLNYIAFKIALLKQDPIEALSFFPTLDVTKNITAQELFQLAHLHLNALHCFDQKAKVSHLEQACEFLYRSHKKGNKEAYPLMVKLLLDKEALENNTLVDAALDRNEITVAQGAELVNRLIHKIQRKDNQETIAFFKGFIAAKKYRLRKANKDESNSKSLELAEDFIKGLSQGFQLSEIVSLPSNLPRIKKRGGFFDMLNPLVEENLGRSLISVLDGLDKAEASKNESNSTLVEYASSAY